MEEATAVWHHDGQEKSMNSSMRLEFGTKVASGFILALVF